MGELRVIIAGGGTGGHVFPAIAIGQALQRLQPETKLLFVGAKGKMEMEKVPKAGFEIIGLDIAGFNRSNLFKNITLPFKLIRTRMQAGDIIKDFRPNAMVGVGGYASFPMLHAGQSAGVPTLLHEGNSYGGRSNKILARKAKAVCVAYEAMDKFFPKETLIMTGNPVRKSIVDMNRTQDEGKAFFGIGDSGKVVLVIGGSLGAKSINEAIDSHLDEIVKDGMQVIWQTGKPYYETAVKRAAKYAGHVKVYDFITEMDYAYAAADVVVSRAGAMATSELCIAGKPVIFVPYPFAAEDHQTSNALALVKHNAAVMVKDNEAHMHLVTKLGMVLHDEKMQEIMSANIKAMAIKDADVRIAKKVMEIAKAN